MKTLVLLIKEYEILESAVRNLHTNLLALQCRLPSLPFTVNAVEIAPASYEILLGNFVFFPML